jgi:N-methylhydantoinase A
MTLATENMVGAIEQITIHQGLDPREAILLGAGGAAGLNSVAIAKRLGCTNVLIPEVGAALSAQGALISDLHADYRALFYTTTDNFDYQGTNAVLEGLIARCREFIQGPGAGAVSSVIELTAEAHYQSQVWEIDVPVELESFQGPEDVAKVREEFDRVHEEVFAFRDPGSEVQFVCWRATARCRLTDRQVGRLLSGREAGGEPSTRPAYFKDLGLVETPVVRFGGLEPGRSLDGPAIVESPFTTVVIEPNSRVTKTDSGSLFIAADCTLDQ